MPDEKYVGVTATALVLKVYAEYLRLRRKQWVRRMQGLARCLGKTNASVTEAAMWMRAENGDPCPNLLAYGGGENNVDA